MALKEEVHFSVLREGLSCLWGHLFLYCTMVLDLVSKKKKKKMEGSRAGRSDSYFHRAGAQLTLTWLTLAK